MVGLLRPVILNEACASFIVTLCSFFSVPTDGLVFVLQTLIFFSLEIGFLIFIHVFVSFLGA